MPSMRGGAAERLILSAADRVRLEAIVASPSFVVSGGPPGEGSVVGGEGGSETGTSAGYFYLFDIRGSVADVVDSNGDIADSYTYDLYGNIISSSGGIPNPYRYDDGYFDSTTGLYHFGDWFYDPADGRWTQLDPSEHDGAYVFSDDDPVNLTDPNGHAPYGRVCGNAGCLSARITEIRPRLYTVRVTITESTFSILSAIVFGSTAVVVGGF